VGLLAGVLIYKRRADLIRVTLGVVLVTLVAVLGWWIATAMHHGRSPARGVDN
jgi:hypothetical protein